MARRAEIVDYPDRHEDPPIYLVTPMLPPDFRRARSLTLQVCSDDLIDWLQFGASIGRPDGPYDHRHTWFEMRIIRPIREKGTPHCGGVVRLPTRTRVEETPYGVVDSRGERKLWSQWQVINHNGVVPWVIHHNRALTPEFIGGYRDIGGVSMSGMPCPGCETFRVDWPGDPDTSTDVANPKGFIDSEGFLSALMPGDKIEFSAGMDVSSPTHAVVFVKYLGHEINIGIFV
jgi:hypothetical protein